MVKKEKYEYNYLNRFENYKNKILNDIILVVMITSAIFVSYIILNISFTLLFSNNCFEIIKFPTYKISNCVYSLFQLFKLFLYLNIISVIIYLTLVPAYKFISYIIFGIILCMTFVFPNHANIVSSLNDYSLFYNFYLFPLIIFHLF